jgi:hypothetical protein
MAMIEGGGISVDLPAGWDAEIYRRIVDPATTSNTSAVATGEEERNNAVLHTANFALPADRGDFGSGAVEIMRASDLLVVLFEYNREDASRALFEHRGIPLPLVASDFSPNAMQRPLKGLLGTQQFFQASGRAWCLYVVLAEANAEHLIADANAVLSTIDIEAI